MGWICTTTPAQHTVTADAQGLDGLDRDLSDVWYIVVHPRSRFDCKWRTTNNI